ncbi:hypothetical protein BH10BAC2_BH10BAC2_06360 [soil metagenome]
MSEPNQILDNEAASKVWKEYENMSNIEYTEKILAKIDALIVLNNSIKKELDNDVIFFWIDPIISKFTFHTSSFLQLFAGTKIKIEGKDLRIFDEPSVLVLFRIILENYLTFYYIFCDSTSREEKEFRVNIWKYCGLKQRNEFDVEQEELKRKQANEFIELTTIKEKMICSPYFKTLKKDEQNSILKGVKPRLYSWTKIMEVSGIRKKLFKNIYGYKSNYAHSEFISILQLNSSVYGFNSLAKEHYTLLLIHMLVSKFIDDLCNLFPSAKGYCEGLNDSFQREINFLKWLLTNESLDSQTIK